MYGKSLKDGNMSPHAHIQMAKKKIISNNTKMDRNRLDARLPEHKKKKVKSANKRTGSEEKMLKQIMRRSLTDVVPHIHRSITP